MFSGYSTTTTGSNRDTARHRLGCVEPQNHEKHENSEKRPTCKIHISKKPNTIFMKLLPSQERPIGRRGDKFQRNLSGRLRDLRQRLYPSLSPPKSANSAREFLGNGGSHANTDFCSVDGIHRPRRGDKKMTSDCSGVRAGPLGMRGVSGCFEKVKNRSIFGWPQGKSSEINF